MTGGYDNYSNVGPPDSQNNGSAQPSCCQQLCCFKRHQNPDSAKGKNCKSQSEVVECITTSFNERIPSPKPCKYVLDTSVQKPLSHPSSYNDNLYRTNSPTNHQLPLSYSNYSNNRVEMLHAPLLPAISSSSSGSGGTTDDRQGQVYLQKDKNMVGSQLIQQSSKTKRRDKRHDKKQDSKAAKTLSAILLAFILTWSPYMLFTMINVFDKSIIPDNLYKIGKSYHLLLQPLAGL